MIRLTKTALVMVDEPTGKISGQDVAEDLGTQVDDWEHEMDWSMIECTSYPIEDPEDKPAEFIDRGGKVWKVT